MGPSGAASMSGPEAVPPTGASPDESRATSPSASWLTLDPLLRSALWPLALFVFRVFPSPPVFLVAFPLGSCGLGSAPSLVSHVMDKEALVSKIGESFAASPSL